jgi:hypothetical protein
MNEPAPAFEARELARWQRRLLPFAIAAISLMAIFFFASSVIQLNRLGTAVSFQPSSQIEQALIRFEEQAGASGATDQDYLRWKTLVLLEREALRHRYAQVNATLLLRAWTRHLGFLTGMILAFVGAVFILARLREEQTQISMEQAGFKNALATSSPGIVLAVLGTVLMIVTLTASFEFTTSDVPVYIGGRQPSEAALPPPRDLSDPEARRAEDADLYGVSNNGESNAVPAR